MSTDEKTQFTAIDVFENGFDNSIGVDETTDPYGAIPDMDISYTASGYRHRKSVSVYNPISIIPYLISLLSKKIDGVIHRIDDIQNSLSLIEDKISLQDSQNNVVEEGEMVTKEQAKDIIMKLFNEKGEIDYVEMLETLNLDLDMIVNTCDELEKEGKIKGVD